ncbi:peptide chain release factor N(5)-glutamine methyltransferase [Microbacterium nymphoidis]|uniref:peptide chain release factor N(5)-glutamine methyltransferase n=1 Tax=Microbacterium nymphoidis TaxID=2898586 RepID=UPI001E4637EF|nr:peptide chain release factor N(5)-glutamine methyltransferase [Microbacterium nymphoidis]MCD2499842.1 peptide chain release factor N(5)-glutamine methyltransferase [Microbacterium nymphoidis]
MTTDSTLTLRAALQAGAAVLAEAGILDAAVDAELLAAHVLELSRGGVQAAVVTGRDLNSQEAAAFDAAIARRAERVPLQHITGRAPFRHLELSVGPGVFVPRPETEILAQFAIDALAAVPSPRPLAVDLGTGSGAIAIALATEVPHARIVAVERSADAYRWAARNVARLTDGNLELRHGSFADALDDLNAQVSVVASNPPYVPADAIPRDPEVRLHDPREALYSGEDGLDDIRTISRVGLRLAHSGGMIVLEHGEWQGQGVRDILTSDGWVAAATHPDLTHRDRVTTAVRP